jgi:hypothetical protein
LRRQRGQALTELALLAPVFALLMLLFSFWARLAIHQLALVQLSRDAVLMLGRNGTLWSAPLSQQQAAVRRLAERQTLLEPRRLRLDFEAVAPLGLGAVAELAPLLQSPLGSKALGWVGLRRYRLSYDLAPRGLLARFFPQGLHLRESLVLHGDPWKMEASTLVEKILR